MNTQWNEIAGDTLETKLKDIYTKFSSTLWKGDNNRIWFQTEDEVMMKPDVIGFDMYKTNICYRTMP